MIKKKTAARERGGSQSADQTISKTPYNEQSQARLLAVAEKEAIAAIEFATAKHPCLCREVMVTFLLKPVEPYSICGVTTALAFLRQFPKSTPQYRSDWLKDKAQEWGGDCAVANGELIIAATYLRLPMKYDDGPNATIGVRLSHAATRTLH